MRQYQMFMDGGYVGAASGHYFSSDNPYTGEPWAEIPRGDEQDVDLAVQAAHRALTTGPWAEMTATERGA
ncbi:aldehyde dehydrogenase family protein, partial [Alcaligenaceae bacterium]|nr:aldehyde dehydrogenase family protein [Alcaligenaceae bacterium]